MIKNLRFFRNIRQLRDNIANKIYFNYFIALAFLAPNLLQTGFNAIIQHRFFQENNNAIEPFINYFKRTWLGYKNKDNNYINPKITIIWNCNKLVKYKGKKLIQ